MAARQWHEDGWDVAIRIGLLVPHADVGPEAELHAMTPPGVAIHATRVPFGAMGPGGGMDSTIPLQPVRRFAEQPELDDAAELLAAAPLDAIAYGFTSSAYVIGASAEAEMVRRLEQRTRGIPVVTPCAAAVDALHALGAHRVALQDGWVTLDAHADRTHAVPFRRDRQPVEGARRLIRRRGGVPLQAGRRASVGRCRQSGRRPRPGRRRARAA